MNELILIYNIVVIVIGCVLLYTMIQPIIIMGFNIKQKNKRNTTDGEVKYILVVGSFFGTRSKGVQIIKIDCNNDTQAVEKSCKILIDKTDTFNYTQGCVIKIYPNGDYKRIWNN